jgi:hypothetical protein
MLENANMDDDQTRTFVEVIAYVDTALELQRAEIEDIRRELADWKARVMGATNEQERDATMLAFANYLTNVMSQRLLEGMNEALRRVDVALRGQQQEGG